MSVTARSLFIRFVAAFGVIFMLVLLGVSASTARDDGSEVVESWFEALRTVDKGAFEAIMSDDAIVDLRFLGITQTKSEYIAALDGWAELAGDLDIKTVVVDASDTVVNLDVCYTFARNQRLNRETFGLRDGRVVTNVQEMIGEKC